MKKLTIDQLNRLSPESYQKLKKLPITIILDNIRSLQNVGAIFRTADAFMIEQIYLCGITGQPPHREITKTAIGAEEIVNWKYYDKTTTAIHALKAMGYYIVAAEQTDHSTSLQTFQYNNQPIALIFGHEMFGVSDEALQMTDQCIEIQQFGTKHSLNVATSMGIIAWEFTQQMRMVYSR